ncbi:MAG: RcpC/CpaB family pilus assembly protein [Planctomycetota bacterium]|nr:RcpC/CpaB family pilus assembly protein [Planctomycetota bacterium]
MASAVIAVLLLVTATVYTVVNGELRIPFVEGALLRFGNDASAAESTAAPKPAPNAVMVYAANRTIPAYTKITRDHLITADGYCTLPVDTAIAEQRGLFREGVEVQKLLGRVLKKEKPALYAFSKTDFLPQGTSPGVNAGIPPGKRGVWIDVSKVTGLADLRTGDRIDLVAATAATKQTTLDTSVLGKVADSVLKARLTAAANESTKASAASSWVVAREAQVIAPTRSRPRPNAGSKRSAATIDEAFLAVAPDDVPRLSQALAQGVTILAAPRSSQPNAEPVEIEDEVPEDATATLRKMLAGEGDGEGTMQMVEVIRGGARETVTVPRQEPRDKGQR